ncbi:hypothetical protein DPMN_118953 [Dreissena polymorpha]|uniref:Uncharacterized protein n=1 Tax=Dreissena polymorpha TaxID=45954 RepID=A0A9D4GHS6_DREPO|nr:hypothetical protein DPMN_118953 [Dreissena polymorpha]
MSDTDTDQENEVFFRDELQQRKRPTSHQDENQVHEEQEPTEQDDHWLTAAFGKLVHMQGQMNETLEGVNKMISNIQRQNESTVLVQNSNIQQQNYLPSLHRYNNFAGEPAIQHNMLPRSSISYSNHKCNNSTKIPTFNGKDEWKVWFNRFETIANRQGWNDEEKLDHLLPKLQGSAGEFVFTQLLRETLDNYDELVREINNRFRIIETPRTFAAKFSQSYQ